MPCGCSVGAIASIAYNESTPVVDGNVMRVLSRLRAISGSIKANHVVAFFWFVGPERECESGHPP